MKNNITELVFILDRSGSMGGLESDTIGGFNAMIQKQKKVDGKCYVSTLLFDNETEVIHDRIPLDRVHPMTENDYEVRGCTALLDAIGGAIKHIGNIHKYARPEDIPANTIFVITTDGMENASKKFASEQVKQLIKRQKTKYGWEFMFLAANIDAVETAKTFGIDENHAVDYHADSKGTACIYETLSDAVMTARQKGKLSPMWSHKIKADYTGRDKQR